MYYHAVRNLEDSILHGERVVQERKETMRLSKKDQSDGSHHWFLVGGARNGHTTAGALCFLGELHVNLPMILGDQAVVEVVVFDLQEDGLPVADLTHLWLLRLAMSRTVCAVSEAKSRAPATGLVTVPTRPLPNPEKKPLTPPSVFTPSTVEVMMLVIPPMIPGEQDTSGSIWQHLD
ncbi:hypothetical protein INR49_022326 [Caranx melampygus]|nr:hypothetical protein INR49_022326 [Caranx melampygus]